MISDEQTEKMWTFFSSFGIISLAIDCYVSIEYQ